MGGLTSAVQELEGASARTVESRSATATRSLSLSTDTPPPEVAQPQKTKIAPSQSLYDNHLSWLRILFWMHRPRTVMSR